MRRVTVSKAAKEFVSCLRKVCDGHETFELMKNGLPCARLVPVEKTHGNTYDLADALSSAALRPEDKRGWATTVAKGRKSLKPLENPWG